MVLVYSESGTSVSPCGSFLAVCLPCAADLPAKRALASSRGRDGMAIDGEEGAAADSGEWGGGAEGESSGSGRSGGSGGSREAEAANHGMIAIISLQETTFAQVLCTSPIPKAAKITCIRFSASCRYLLVGYGVCVCVRACVYACVGPQGAPARWVRCGDALWRW